MACPLCGSSVNRFRRLPWLTRCRGCGVWRSSLRPAIGEESAVALDEDSRMAGLRPVRDAGYRRILGEVAALRPLLGSRVLDVGTGHGWFLEAAGAGGAQAVGIEPDAGVAAAARDRGLDVRVGYFPEALRADDRFHVVAYNDVFEHLPDPDAILDATRAALAPAGLLTIAIPTSEGLGYRLALWAAALGFMTPLRRLWQFDFPSPHVWYFDERSLGSLLERSGFVLERVGRLPSIERNGLRERLNSDPRRSAATTISAALAWLLAPVLNRPANSDAMFMVLRRG
jgi:SAM-dependent methyltransferase